MVVGDHDCEDIMRADQDRFIRSRGARRGSRRGAFVAAVLATALALTSGCTGGGDDRPSAGQDGGEKAPEAVVTITTPQADAKDVPASTGIAFTAEKAQQTTVELKDPAGAVV